MSEPFHDENWTEDQRRHARAAGDLARRYREAGSDGSRARLMLDLAGGGFNVETLEMLLAQHADLYEAATSCDETDASGWWRELRDRAVASAEGSVLPQVAGGGE